jgi:4-coumarate--CoA ligase
MPIVKDHFDNLEVAISGAAPLGKDLQIAASAKLGKGRTFISQTWGLSETTGSVSLFLEVEEIEFCFVTLCEIRC